MSNRVVNHVILQGVLYILGVEEMRVERLGPADVERRYSGYLVIGSDAEKARHPIRISTEKRADVVIAEWKAAHPDPTYGSPAIVEGRLMSILGGESYVLVEWIRFIGTDALSLRRGNMTPEHVRRVGSELYRRSRGV